MDFSDYINVVEETFAFVSSRYNEAIVADCNIFTLVFTFACKSRVACMTL